MVSPAPNHQPAHGQKCYLTLCRRNTPPHIFSFGVVVWGVVEAIISPRIGLTFGHKDDLTGGMTRKGHRWRTHIYKHADTRRDTPRHAAAPQHTCAPIQTHAHEPTHPRAIAPASAHARTCPHAHTLPSRRPNPKCPCYLRILHNFDRSGGLPPDLPGSGSRSASTVGWTAFRRQREKIADSLQRRGLSCGREDAKVAKLHSPPPRKGSIEKYRLAQKHDFLHTQPLSLRVCTP